MAIKHILLALLAEESAYGYELKKRYDEALGDLWPLQQAQVYNNLRLLEKAGQIALDVRVTQDNLPDQKLFRMTEAGTSELTTWLAEPVTGNRHLKDEFYLKLTTLATILQRSEQLTDLIWQQRTVYLQTLRELERALATTEERGNVVAATLLDGAILHIEADLAWLDRIEERRLPDGPGELEGFGGRSVGRGAA